MPGLTRLRAGRSGATRPPASPDGQMSLIEHLRELRSRLFKCVLAVVPGVVVGWVFYDQVIEFLLNPACDTVNGKKVCPNVTFIGLLAPFNLNLTVACMTGLLLASPVWLYQIWAFVTPGLHRNERRWTLIFLGTAIPLFFAGAALCYWMFPRAVEILQGFTPDEANNIIDVREYLSIFMRLLLVFGLAFELPVFVVLLNFVGILPARAIRRAWRWIILGSCVFGAVATPTGDPFTMLAVALPMIVLVAVAWVIAAVHDRRKAGRSDELSYAGLGDDDTSPLDVRPSRLDDLD